MKRVTAGPPAATMTMRKQNMFSYILEIERQNLTPQLRHTKLPLDIMYILQS